MDIHQPEAFGAAQHQATPGMTITDVLADAPAIKEGSRPAVTRLMQGARANIIAFHFATGQELPDHQAAHPVTIQGLSGTLTLNCAGQDVILEPGRVVHLADHVVHAVTCQEGPAVLLLTMLTGQDAS